MALIPGWTMGRANWATAQGVNIQEALTCYWNNRKYAASKLRFPQAREFHRKSSAIWACAFKVCQPCPGPKMSRRNIGMKGCHIINLPGTPTCLGPALLLQCRTDMEYFQKLVKKYTQKFLKLRLQNFSLSKICTGCTESLKNHRLRNYQILYKLNKCHKMYSTLIQTDHNLTYTLHITYCLKVNNHKQGENATLRLYCYKFNMYRLFFSNYFPYKNKIKQHY